MKTLLIITLSIVFSTVSYARTYTANTPAWRGEWIWSPRKPNAPVMTVNLREWLEARPGGWEQALVNRVLGNAIVGGIGKVCWRLDDGRGNALFPFKNKQQVLRWPNWGVDFSTFDYPAAAAEFAKRCGMKITFVADQRFLAAAEKRYPKLNIQSVCPVSGNKIDAVELNPSKAAWQWLNRRVYEFKKEFKIAGPISQARLCITADATYRVYIDGKLIGSDGDWWRGETYDMTVLLPPGKHTIRAIVKPSRKYSGLLINLEWRDSGGVLHQLNTGDDWLCRAIDSKKWTRAAVVGYEGVGPRFRLKDVWRNPRIPICTQKRILEMVEIDSIKFNASTRKSTARNAADNSHSTFWVGKGSGATLTLDMKRPVLLTGIRIYSGCLGNHGNPSGACALKAYRLQYYNGTNWENLVAPVTNAPNYHGETAEGYRFCHAFTPRKVQKIRLVIDRSHDTLRRNTGLVPASQMTGIVREIQLIKAFGEK
jgi:F5/8 type C domain-containing protein